MGRPKFRITVDNLMHAARYLDGRLGSLAFIPKTTTSQQARAFINELLLLPKSAKSAERLQSWCDANLDLKFFRMLQTAVRKRRQRCTANYRVVTVSTRAFLLLRQLAKRDNVTLTEALERSVQKALRAGC